MTTTKRYCRKSNFEASVGQEMCPILERNGGFWPASKAAITPFRMPIGPGQPSSRLMEIATSNLELNTAS